VGIVGALVLLGGAVAIFVFGSDDSADTRDRLRSAGRKVLYTCQACKATGKITVQVDKDNPGLMDHQFPQPCPECKATKAVLGLKCTKCTIIFPKPPSNQLLYYCPDCGAKYDLRPGGLTAPRRDAKP